MRINHIYTGNCLDFFETIESNAVDHVFTSPPYNRKRNDKYEFYNDDAVDYYDFIKEVIKQSVRVSKEHVFFNIQKNYYNKRDVFKLIGEFADMIVDIIIWGKTNPMPASGTNVTNSYEFVLVLHEDAKPLKANSTYTKNLIMTNVYSNNPYKTQHRAVMNPEFAKKIFSNFIEVGSTVLDPFMGVGTTAVVAKELGMNYVGVELSSEYVSIAEKRLNSMCIT